MIAGAPSPIGGLKDSTQCSGEVANQANADYLKIALFRKSARSFSPLDPGLKRSTLK
jgi:hypothetical protein